MPRVEAVYALQGFGAKVIAYDVYKSDKILAAGIPYVELDEIFEKSDIISLHVPLLPTTYHLINKDTYAPLQQRRCTSKL